ncbi:MAG: ORF6N domain-containing protein [Bacteroidales bacterium]|nr:ORF6N domain-containing protein [Bacteroidales bacterium]
MKKKELKTKREDIAFCDNPQKPTPESRIFTIRNVQVILDRDLAELFGVQTFRLNEQVKRNLKRFPQSFRFQLTEEEKNEVIANCDRLISLKFHPGLPYAFTEQGVAMLSSVLHSKEAIEISIRIMEAFVAMRHFILSNAQIFQRLERIEYKQLEADQKFEQLFKQLEEKTVTPKQGIFYDGQIYDAYEFVSNLIRQAKREIIVIDNYVNEDVLTMLDKRNDEVKATIFTKRISTQLQLDIQRHNSQYPPIDIRPFGKSHDRFLLIDDQVFHIGASLKDLGKSWFAFSLMEDLTPNDLISSM